MPLNKIHIRPGVSAELTPTAAEGMYSSSQLIRFFAGQLQKIGGWVKITGATVVGICRALFGWSDLVGNAHLAVGSDQRLYVLTGDVLYDITPVIATSNIAPALATTIGSAVVTITDATTPPAVGDWINLTVPIGIAGAALLVPAGFYQVGTVPSGTTYTITVPTTATASSGPGAVPTYTTTLGSAVVTVVLASHGLALAADYEATMSTTVGGVVVNGSYAVSAVLDVNTFQITAGSVATGAATVSVNTGLMQILYLLASGLSVSSAVGGFGSGDFGGGDWGGTTPDSSASAVALRTWSFDQFGQDLIASPDLGAIYYWQPPTVTPAVVLSATAPTINKVVFAMPQAQIIIAAGSSVAGVYNPTLVRWCDSGNFTDWTSTVTNQAGSYQLPSGSYVTAGLATGLGALIWTDVDLWSMTYQGLPFVFGFNQIATKCGALSKRAPAVIGQQVIWPSKRGFFRYAGGGVAPVECPVWDYFYNNIDMQQSEQCCAALNVLYNEVSWYFRSTVSDTRYVKWNYLEDLWDYGVLERTAWSDHTPYDSPVGTDTLGNIFIHENGNDADGSPLECYGQTGYFDLHDGEEVQYVDAIIPDFLLSTGATVQMTIYATDNPGDTARTYGPYAITSTTRRFNVSLRGRQVALRFASSDLGSTWRTGATRVSSKQAGRRP